MADGLVVLQKSEELELLAAEIYRALAERFASDAEHRSLFERLEKEELQHAARVNMLASHYLRDRKKFAELPIDVTALDDALARGKTLLERVPTLSLVQAILECAGAEKAFASAHAEVLAKNSIPMLGSFFEKLAAADREHAKLLHLKDR